MSGLMKTLISAVTMGLTDGFGFLPIRPLSRTSTRMGSAGCQDVAGVLLGGRGVMVGAGATLFAISKRGSEMIPGEMFIADGEIELNAGRKTVTLSVANTGDRPIQVGSHYHFFETNPALKFDRKKAPRHAPRYRRRHRRALRAGADPREVQLVALAGKRMVAIRN